MKKITFLLMLASGMASMLAEAPAGYYSSLEGKKGDELKNAVKAVSMPEDFEMVSYGEDSWTAFQKTDVRTVEGRQIWRDMYSNRMVYVSTGHDGLNIEHSVANSWWGGKNGSREAYSDLMHLNPSDADANNKKSNHPLGKVADARLYDNGISKIGTPFSGFGGGAATVFEPVDEYKGDFARAYLYIFTAYADIPWKEDANGKYMLDIATGSVKPQAWVIDMLLSWAAADPVDDVEMARNEEIYKIQHNRNPFIDFPALGEYIYGSKKGEAFATASNKAAEVNRPAEPVATGLWLTGVNTYSGRYWTDNSLSFDYTEGNLWISCDGGSYQQYGSQITIPQAKAHGEKHTIRAYTTEDPNGEGLRSPIVYVTMTGKDTSVTDYTGAVWTPVTMTSEITPDSYYLILSENVKHVMSYEGSNFLQMCGFPRFDGDNITCISDEAALVRFVPVSGAESQYTLLISDPLGKEKGYWQANASNKMKLNAASGTAAEVTVDENGRAIIKFSVNGSLQYNKTQPRFTNYATNQGAVVLYKFKEFPQPGSGIETPSIIEEAPVAVSSRDIIVPEGGAVYDLNGRRVSGMNLAPGVYVAVTPQGRAVKIAIR